MPNNKQHWGSFSQQIIINIQYFSKQSIFKFSFHGYGNCPQKDFRIIGISVIVLPFSTYLEFPGYVGVDKKTWTFPLIAPLAVCMSPFSYNVWESSSLLDNDITNSRLLIFKGITAIPMQVTPPLDPTLYSYFTVEIIHWHMKRFRVEAQAVVNTHHYSEQSSTKKNHYWTRLEILQSWYNLYYITLFYLGFTIISP